MRTTISVLILAGVLASPGAGQNKDEFLHSLYQRLHDSPAQRKFRKLAPMPFGVVFLPWKGLTEAEMRRHFRLMKQLGFHNLKQAMGTPEWPLERVLEIALEEDVIPFWYGEAGWEDITPALLRKLGIPESLDMAAIRRHPKMRAYQKEVLRKQIPAALQAVPAPTEVGREAEFRHTPDPFLKDHDVPHFRKWLRSTYRSPAEINEAWNLYEVGITPSPFQSWEDVDRAVEAMSREPDTLRGFGREYGRIRDVLRYKADGLTAAVRRRFERFTQAYPGVPTRTGGEMGLFLPFAWRATRMEDLAQTQRETGSFYPSIHFAWHYGEVRYEVARTIYMQAQFANDLFKGGWAATWESTGGPQQLTGAKGWDYEQGSTTPGFTVNAGTMTQLFLSYLAAGFKGAGVWAWNYRRAGWEGGEYGLLNRQLKPSPRAIRAGKIAQAAERLRDELWQARKEPYVGVLLNWDSDAIWAATSVRGRDHFRHYPMQARVGISRALINGNIPWEYVTVDDLSAGLAPRYKVIYLPAQLALSDKLIAMLDAYVVQGGRLVLDSPGGWYTETGRVLDTSEGSPFEKLFGAELADFQYSNNVPRFLNGLRMKGFITEIHPTRAAVTARFQTGEAAATEYRHGKGTAVLLGWDASFAVFSPGNDTLEDRLRNYTMGSLRSPYACRGAVVYRLAAPQADHYFFINDDEPKQVYLDTGSYQYVSAADPVSGEALRLGEAIALEGYSGRWVRFARQ